MIDKIRIILPMLVFRDAPSPAGNLTPETIYATSINPTTTSKCEQFFSAKLNSFIAVYSESRNYFIR